MIFLGLRIKSFNVDYSSVFYGNWISDNLLSGCGIIPQVMVVKVTNKQTMSSALTFVSEFRWETSQS